MAMDVRYATPEDDLRPLWHACFGDGDEAYFRREYRPGQTLVIADGSGPPAAMMHMLFQTLRVPAQSASGLSGREIQAAYVMGVGTHPDFRGQGFAGDLLEQLVFELHLRSIPMAMLLPCGAPMARFYAKYGFRQLGVMPGFTGTPAGEERRLTEVTDTDAAELNALYERLCTGTASLRRDVPRWTQIAEDYELYLGAGRYRVLDQGKIMEDSAAALKPTEVSACVKIIEADTLLTLMAELGYAIPSADFRDAFCPWNGRKGGITPEDMLEGLPFFANLLYNERTE